MSVTGQTRVEQPNGWTWSPIRGYTQRRAVEVTNTGELAAVEQELKAEIGRAHV